MPSYRKKPVVIEAFRWGHEAVPDWLMHAVEYGDVEIIEGIQSIVAISTLEGVMQAYPGDWIIKGVHGELYPCKHEIFEQTYEAV